jgi:Granulin
MAARSRSRSLFLSFSALLLVARAQWPTLCPNQPADPYAAVRCPTNFSCAENDFSQGGKMGCCPFPNAVKCGDYSCCPGGTTCNLISGAGYSAVFSCDKAGAPNSSGVISKCPCKPGAPIRFSSTLKNVIVIGQSSHPSACARPRLHA